MNSSDTSDLRKRVWLHRNRFWVLLAYMAAIIPATYFATQLKTDNSIERWLGETDPAVQRYDMFRESFHVQPQVTAVVEDIGPMDPRIEQYAELLESLPIVKRVWTLRRIGSVLQMNSTQTISGRQLINDQLFGDTSLQQLFVPNGNSTAVWIELSDAALKDSRLTVSHLRHAALLADFPEESVHLGGPLVINAALDRWGRLSLESVLPILAASCLLMLCILCGSLRDSLLLSFSASVSVLITLALMSAVGESMNLLLVALPPLIAVLHLSVGIHILHHFHYPSMGNLTPMDDASEAVDYAIHQTFTPAALATLTTVIGMASLMISDLQPVATFGMWAGVGLLVSFAVAYSLVPCLLFEGKPVPVVKLRCRWISPRLPWVRRIVLAASGLVLIGAAFGWEKLQPECNAMTFLPPNCRTLKDYDFIEANCFGLIPVELVVDLNKFPQSQHQDMLQQIGHRLEEHSDVTHALGLYSFAPRTPKPAPASNVPVSARSRNTQRRELRKHWQIADTARYRISALVRSDASDHLGDVAADLKHSVGSIPVEVTGLVSLIDESQHAIFSSLRNSLMIACLLVAVVLIIVLRSLPAGLVALIPNIGPIIVGFGLLGWVGKSLDVASMLTASIALGVALDDSLHFLHQFRNVPGTSRSTGRAVRRTWQICSWPMIQTSVVAATGLGVLGISRFRPVANFGLLMSVLLMLALVADLIVLPCLLTTSASSLFRRVT